MTGVRHSLPFNPTGEHPYYSGQTAHSVASEWTSFDPTKEDQQYEEELHRSELSHLLRCPRLGDIDNGVVKVKEVENVKRAEYRCRVSFRVSGTHIRLCGIGTHFNWTGSEPSCVSG